ncbi:MAG: Phage protein [Oscillospiraceae bacterium]
MSIQDWIALVSTLVAFLSLLVTLLRSMRSQAKQDGKTTEVLRQVNDKLENIARQEAANSARIEAIVERVVVVEQSAKQAHFRIDELRDELHK